MNPINLALRFFLEVAALSALGWWGWAQTDSWWRIVWAISVVLLTGAAWGLFAVPNDPSRGDSGLVHTPGIARLLLELLIFGAAACALDAKRLRAWYQGAFGFLPSGGTVFAGTRIASVRDPEGNWVEIFEEDPLGSIAPRRRGLRSTRQSGASHCRSRTSTLPARFGWMGSGCRSLVARPCTARSTGCCGTSIPRVENLYSFRREACSSSWWSTKPQSHDLIHRTTGSQTRAT